MTHRIYIDNKMKTKYCSFTCCHIIFVNKFPQLQIAIYKNKIEEKNVKMIFLKKFMLREKTIKFNNNTEKRIYRIMSEL